MPDAARSTRGICLAMALAAAALGAAPPARASHGSSAVQTLWTTPSSGWTANEEHVGGTYVYTDQVYDDRGPNTSASSGGDYTYPQDGAPYMRNAADIVEVRLRRDGDGLIVGARLNTLLDPAVPIVAVGFVDPGVAGKAVAWPGAGVRADGVRWVVIIAQAGVTVMDIVDHIVLPAPPAAIYADTDAEHAALENTMTAVVPLGDIAAQSFHAYAVAGVDGWFRPAGATTPPVFDLAFLRSEAFTNFENDVQAQTLASGDITAARGTVDLSIVDRAAVPRTGAAQSRIYRPSITTGEGVGPNRLPVADVAGTQPAVALGNWYHGLYLPYGVWIPSGYDGSRAMPLFVGLHGVSESHLSYQFSHWVDGRFTADALAIAPLGRSDSGYYQGGAALDVFEALEDAKRALAVDDDRVYLSGMSMGGLGTYTIGTQRPDLFAAAFPIVGPGSGQKDFLWPLPLEPVMGPARDVVTIYRLGSFGRELLDNAINLPFRIFMGTVDYFVPPTYSEGDIRRWEELGYDYDAVLFLQRRHEIVAPWQDASYKRGLRGCTPEVAHPGCDLTTDPSGLVRDSNPARVVYKTLPWQSWPQLSPKLVFDGAYWVDGMVVRDATAADMYGKIDVTSHALAAKRRAPSLVMPPALYTYDPSGGDLYKFQGRRWTVQPGEVSNGFDASLHNLSAVSLDVARMALDTGQPVAMHATGDGATALTLQASWPDGTVVRVLRGGTEIATGTVEHGEVTVLLDLSGTADYVVTTG